MIDFVVGDMVFERDDIFCELFSLRIFWNNISLTAGHRSGFSFWN
jgi:hypothetical protein